VDKLGATEFEKEVDSIDGSILPDVSVGSPVRKLVVGVFVESLGSTIESVGSLLEDGTLERNKAALGASALDDGTLVESVGATVDTVGASVLDDGALVV
jgi:hypothetical protein